ncbi:CRP-like cAMP-binding protein [Enterobacter sp. BIGb0383]|uniref:helix-turn-helix domain-containing protein n=1 Tax=unclassified Enterobacter TaxID=2608935 RepID=UPI000F488B3E|nr:MULTISPECIES: helix-turn-helix domain-containing protein [unclassified Enterobacter]ROP59985.1 CRP-like cAMP-binding protein [Enterobacter sp. BIGb0383]ROS08546.1 CRP-like cAMP-binding protein [Enterobacter sp. BIGb0359]
MHRVIKNHESVIDYFAGHAQVANPDEISRGKRRYHFCQGDARRVFFILEGDFLLKLQTENKILNILSAPFVMGVNPSLDAPPLYLERVDYGKVSYVEYDFFWKRVLEKDLLDDVMSIMSGQYTDLMNYILLSKSNSHDQVIALLDRWQKIPSHLKRRFSALYLIEHSSYLSKSSISRVLKELKDSGKLTLERGRLSHEDEFTRA